MKFWQEGRSSDPQHPYYKFKVFASKLLKMDCYILKYPVGSYIGWHLDPSEYGYTHHRLNIVLKKAKIGGGFMDWYSKDFYVQNRFNYFRPDTTFHGVEKIKSGTRYVLSIGWLRRIK